VDKIGKEKHLGNCTLSNFSNFKPMRFRARLGLFAAAEICILGAREALKAAILKRREPWMEQWKDRAG
jgi:hypothetical protein